eukprot:Skav234506  [mRNA]  locus=scaffold1613:214351:215427:- [translate_table: standard]
MAPLSRDAKMKISSIIDATIPVHTLCPCVKYFTAVVFKLGDFSIQGSKAVVHVRLVNDTPFVRDNFIGVTKGDGCDHAMVDHVQVHMNEEDALNLGASTKWLLHNVRYSAHSQVPFIDARHCSSGIMRFGEEEIKDEKKIMIAELFSGGFSGWSHSIRALRTWGRVPLVHKWVLDNDAIATTAYCQAHGAAKITDPAQAFNHVCSEERKDEKRTLAFHADVKDGWFLNYAGAIRDLDYLLASPPCQSWSSAADSLGLNRSDGMVMVFTVVKTAVIRPRYLLLEEVKNFCKHEHFPLVVELFRWANYELVTSKVMELDEILPQKRDRYLAVFMDTKFSMMHPVTSLCIRLGVEQWYLYE